MHFIARSVSRDYTRFGIKREIFTLVLCLYGHLNGNTINKYEIVFAYNNLNVSVK